ncbi:hypothetical protein PMAYCL1PPCAC_22439, partial [Pristionchus mayeri]
LQPYACRTCGETFNYKLDLYCHLFNNKGHVDHDQRSASDGSSVNEANRLNSNGLNKMEFGAVEEVKDTEQQSCELFENPVKEEEMDEDEPGPSSAS